MMQVLIALAWGVGTFAIVVGVMSIVVQSFVTATGCLGPDYTYYNLTSNVCQNSSTTASISSIATNKAGTTLYYLQGQLGSTSGGLSTYAPIIIVVGIAMVIFAAFGGKGKRY
jgi:hypothetical protein